MNSVPEHITEQLTETRTNDSDRRHGMKLIASRADAKRSRFRISVDDELLSKGIGPGGMGSQRNGLLKIHEDLTIGSAVVLAALAGLAIGFFLGRREDQ